MTFYVCIKRVGDILLSLAAIIILSPVLLVSALLLLCTGEHLVLYRQRRVGKNYRPFNIYKFVTMRSDSEKSGTITAKNDPRVLPVGRVLRKTKINELPQLFNILFGHMSVVGPRPLVRSEVDMYPEDLRQIVYADNQPGLTGMGSLFFRNEDDLLAATGKEPATAYREDIMPIKGALEAWYRDHKGFAVDCKIVVLTAWAVLHPGSAPVIESFRNAPGFPEKELTDYRTLLARIG
ncbi:sugar transferase [Alkalispirochaeta alkalica]|uniref:sugar transferase n=1 Tax=Alkalispirochaeta alkalica TaxID=46356 RepID=UPI0003731D9D|nr:sugar transferase [Alkalispirochaeta alkalica]